MGNEICSTLGDTLKPRIGKLVGTKEARSQKLNMHSMLLVLLIVFIWLYQFKHIFDK